MLEVFPKASGVCRRLASFCYPNRPHQRPLLNRLQSFFRHLAMEKLRDKDLPVFKKRQVSPSDVAVERLDQAVSVVDSSSSFDGSDFRCIGGRVGVTFQPWSRRCRVLYAPQKPAHLHLRTRCSLSDLGKLGHRRLDLQSLLRQLGHLNRVKEEWINTLCFSQELDIQNPLSVESKEATSSSLPSRGFFKCKAIFLSRRKSRPSKWSPS